MAWTNTARAKAQQSIAAKGPRKAPCRIEIMGLRELRQACKGTPEAVNDLKDTNKRIAEKVIEWAKPDMPHKTGAFAAGFKGSRIQRGGQIINKVKHAGWNEFGGGIGWKSKSGDFVRVPIGGGFRMMKRNPIKMKSYPPDDSWHIYPTFLSHEDDIQKIYGDEITRIFTSYW